MVAVRSDAVIRKKLGNCRWESALLPFLCWSLKFQKVGVEAGGGRVGQSSEIREVATGLRKFWVVGHTLAARTWPRGAEGQV